MTFVATDPVSHKGKSTTWLTPPWLIQSLGDFDLDPCAHFGHRTARLHWCLSDGMDGLAYDWSGRVWLNPPYGTIVAPPWIRKLQNHGNGIALLPSRLDSKWIQPFIAKGFFQLEGRIKFLNEKFETESNHGTGSILIPFGRNNLAAILSSNLKGRWFQ